MFRDDTDRRRFMGAVAESPARYGLEVHAVVLMDNHYHLLVRPLGMKYQAAAQAVKRFREVLADEPDRTEFISWRKRLMSII